MSNRGRAAPAVLIGLALLSACRDEETPVTPPSGVSVPVEMSATIDPAQYVPRPEEAEFAELAREIPGTAGFFVDDQGQLVVFAKDLGRTNEIEAWLAKAASRYTKAGETGKVVVRQGKYDFFELAFW